MIEFEKKNYLKEKCIFQHDTCTTDCNTKTIVLHQAACTGIGTLTAISTNIESRCLGKTNIVVEAGVILATDVRIGWFKVALTVVAVWAVLGCIKVFAHRRIISIARIGGGSALEATCVYRCIDAACDTF